MSVVFCHSGNSGDIVYSIPTIKHLSGSEPATVYIKAVQYASPNGNQFDFVERFLTQQGITPIPFIPEDNDWSLYHWPWVKYDYDLDKAREQRQRGTIHIIKRYFDAFGIAKDHKQPFITVDNLYKRNEKFALIHLTSRWNGLQYDWCKIYEEAMQRHGKVYFVGFQYEWLDFTIRYEGIEHLPTNDLLDLARLVRDAEAVYCNQGVVLTLAQGMGKDYWLVRNGNKTNCHLGTFNEHLYGREYLIPDHTMGNSVPNSHIVNSPFDNSKT